MLDEWVFPNCPAWIIRHEIQSDHCEINTYLQSFNDVDVKKKFSPQEIAEMHKEIDRVMLNAADIPSNATTGTDGIKRKKVTPDGGTNKVD